jgi:agmatinase
MAKSNPSTSGLSPGTVVVLGAPFDRNSSFLHGPALAPPAIREALHCESTNLCTEAGIDLGTSHGWQDLGDLDLSDACKAFAKIEAAVQRLLGDRLRVITLGGDHSITYPALRAFAKKSKNLSILQLDAHPDLYDDLDDNRFSHACPFARIMEEGLAAKLIQVGIRAMTNHQREQAKRFGVEVIEMRKLKTMPTIKLDGDVYLSVDMDCLDPAFTPGVSHREPGGLSTRDVLQLIQNLKGNLVGADLVEFNPERDPSGMTGMVAAKLLKEMIGRMLSD